MRCSRRTGARCICYVTRRGMWLPQVCWRTGSTNPRNGAGSCSSAPGAREAKTCHCWTAFYLSHAHVTRRENVEQWPERANPPVETANLDQQGPFTDENLREPIPSVRQRSCTKESSCNEASARDGRLASGRPAAR